MPVRCRYRRCGATTLRRTKCKNCVKRPKIRCYLHRGAKRGAKRPVKPKITPPVAKLAPTKPKIAPPVPKLTVQIERNYVFSKISYELQILIPSGEDTKFTRKLRSENKEYSFIRIRRRQNDDWHMPQFYNYVAAQEYKDLVTPREKLMLKGKGYASLCFLLYAMIDGKVFNDQSTIYIDASGDTYDPKMEQKIDALWANQGFPNKGPVDLATRKNILKFILGRAAKWGKSGELPEDKNKTIGELREMLGIVEYMTRLQSFYEKLGFVADMTRGDIFDVPMTANISEMTKRCRAKFQNIAFNVIRK